MNTSYHAIGGSSAENLFIALFEDVFGAEKTGFLYSQYPFFDIYQNARFADFLLENGGKRVAIEIDDDASHLPGHVSQVKHYDDITKQNSMIHLGWDVYRWPVKLMQEQPERVKDEIRIFIGSHPLFRTNADYLPTQRGKSFQLKEHQQEALHALSEMRKNKETIALIHHATGTGKTVTAVSDAKAMNGRTLYLAHTKDLITQAADTFRDLWPEASLGLYVENIKQTDAQIICASIQSIALNLEDFAADAFDYIIIDEAHHASAETYQKVLAFFTPRFTLGLTATPERADGQDILEVFKNTAHRLDIETAVEIGELAPVRSIRIHTNIDLTKVRFNSIQYNIRDLESKIFVPERNQLIVDTWLEFVRDKRTVIFCASVKHAKQIASMLVSRGIPAMAVSGSMKLAERNEATAKFAEKKLIVLCACDLLNEGWDCPETEVLFMARPTMSKVLYTQQLGRGMRNAKGKEYLMVFDFVDNASQYNMPFSLHRLFHLKDYHPGELALAPKDKRAAEAGLYAKGERPDAVVDYPIDATDYELVDLFNWQEEATGMISQMEFVRRVDVQSETVERYIHDGLITPDLVVPISDHRFFKYFKEETLLNAANQFGWTIIDDSNRKEMFMGMIRRMDMSYSYKPVLILAVLEYVDRAGNINLCDIVSFFRRFYAERKAKGLVVEKSNSIYCKENITDKEIERNILMNPFKRFEDMQMLYHTKTLGIIQIDSCVWKKLSDEEKAVIKNICCDKLDSYYKHLDEK